MARSTKPGRKTSASVKPQRITVYYNVAKHGDVARAIAQLQKNSTQFAGRQYSEVARMLIVQRLAQLAEQGVVKWQPLPS